MICQYFNKINYFIVQQQFEEERKSVEVVLILGCLLEMQQSLTSHSF
jgi:hypothetical protein